MGRQPLPKNVALADQVLAVLDAADLPLRTHDVAKALGSRMAFPDFDRAYCEGCERCTAEDRTLVGSYHHGPVRRSYQGSDIRPILKRLVRAGRVEELVFDGYSWHYWRSIGAST